MRENKQEALAAIGRDKGLNVVILDDHKQMALNKQFYRGHIDDFHTYTLRDVKGKTYQGKKVSTQIAKRIAEDVSSLLFNEDSEIYYEEDGVNDVLQSILRENRFHHQFSDFLETTYGALGNGYAVIYLKEGMPKLDFINGDDVYITKHDNGQTYGIVVVAEKTVGKEEYMHLTFHTIHNDRYECIHEFYKNGEKLTTLQNIEEVFGVEADSLKAIQKGGQFKFEVMTDYKYFVHFKPAIKNNHDIKSPYGISIIANARDLIKSLDDVYTSSIVEYENGKNRIFVNTSLLEKKMIPHSDGSVDMIDFFDGNKTEYVAMPLGEGQEPIKVFNPTLREAEFEGAINRTLSMIGFQVGFGKSYYSMKDGVVSNTATEVKMNKSDLWRNIKKHQNLLEEQLIELAAGLLDAAGISFDVEKIKVHFDDSIIIDDEAEYQKDLVKYEKGLMSKKQFLMKHEQLTEQEAQEWVKEIDEESNLGVFDESIDTESMA